MDAVRQANRTKGSIAQDKVATPPEPAKVTEDFVHALSPTYIVAERNTRSQANIAENYKTVFSDFGDLNEIRARATIPCLTVANSFAGSVRFFPALCPELAAASASLVVPHARFTVCKLKGPSSRTSDAR